ncbi:MAG: hypothetical protein QM820_02320 [Minicystis sp.]
MTSLRMLSSRLVSTSLAALGAAAILCAPRPARAADGGIAVSPGITFSVSFGQKVTYGLGADLRVTGLLQGRIASCNTKSRLGLGGFAQVTWLMNVSAVRVAAGLHGGGEVYEQNVATDAELGWTFRSGIDDEHPAQHGLHVGALGIFVPKRYPTPLTPSLEVPLRVVFPLTGLVRTPEITPGLGVRLPNMFGLPSDLCEFGEGGGGF